MKRIELVGSNPPCFIGAWFLTNPRLCQDLIEFFERNVEQQREGATSGGLHITAKKSTDLPVNPRDLRLATHSAIANYMRELYECHLDYLQQWPFLAGFLAEVDIGSFNIQRYQAGEHFSGVHSERCSLGNLHRVLAWMTYLNDVEDGGYTNFRHYGLNIKPERGKTLIWPAEWTHAHSGGVVESGVKYIITGWMHFPLEGKKLSEFDFAAEV